MSVLVIIIYFFQNCAPALRSSSPESLSSVIDQSSLEREGTSSSQSMAEYFFSNDTHFVVTDNSSAILSGGNNQQVGGSQNPTTTPDNVEVVESTAPGAACSRVSSVSGLGLENLKNGYKAAFTSIKVNQSVSWANGTLTKNADGTLSYNDRNPGSSLILNESDSPESIALANPYIGRLWMKQYGIQFGVTRASLLGTIKAYHHLFAHPMGPNKEFLLALSNTGVKVTTSSVAGAYTFHTPDGPMNSVQFSGSVWCVAMTSDWGQAH